MGFTSQDIQYAKEVQSTYGVPASVTLAQYAYESGYGTSNLAKKNNNYFGMRNGSKGWQKFDSKKDSFLAYGKLLSGELYTSKTKDAENVTQYVNAMAETYAPASDGNNNYAENILKIISENNLTQYDTTFSGGGGTASTGAGAGRTTAQEYGLKWWGDVVKVVFCILILVFGVMFLGFAVTSGQPTAAVKKAVKKAGGKKK